MGRKRRFPFLDAPRGERQELLHSREELQPSFGSACFERKAIPGQDEGCNGFSLDFLSALVTAANSRVNHCLSTQVRASVLTLPFSQSCAQGSHQDSLKPHPAIIPLLQPAEQLLALWGPRCGVRRLLCPR